MESRKTRGKRYWGFVLRVVTFYPIDDHPADCPMPKAETFDEANSSYWDTARSIINRTGALAIKCAQEPTQERSLCWINCLVKKCSARTTIRRACAQIKRV